MYHEASSHGRLILEGGHHIRFCLKKLVLPFVWMEIAQAAMVPDDYQTAWLVVC